MLCEAPQLSKRTRAKPGGGNTMVFNRHARALLKKVSDADVLLHDWFAYQVISAAGGVVLYDSRPSLKYRQHTQNLIGSNLGMGARAERIKLLFQGKWEYWTSLNLQALELLSSDISDKNKRTIGNFVKMRSVQWLPQRLWYFVRSGVYRQTFMGNVGLLIGVLMRKI